MQPSRGGRPHRGHRLGLLVKVAMHQWLARAEPGIRDVFTCYRVSGCSRSWELAIGGPPQSPQS
ncbi:MAG TPA: hypothetical protein VFX25_27150 [Streptosporangiaceae bacterium]|nr:hypothetical protein [Streptosporangiaceae bacterium]